MILLKKISIFISIFIYLAFGLILHFLVTFIRTNQRSRIISNWTKVICVFFRKILGVRLIIQGEIAYLKERGNFIISNHQGYLDGVILGSLFPVVFISKLQVKSWPIFGLMTRVSNTVFIDREKKLKSADSIEEISDMLKKKINALLFPEGTSTDGSKILPFQSVFFQAPLNSKSSIIPITIQYLKIDSEELSLLNRDKVCWYGQINFFKHLLNLLEVSNIEVKVVIHPKIKMDTYAPQLDSRKQLSEACRQVIAKDFVFTK